MSYAWEITKDHIEGGKAVGIQGPMTMEPLLKVMVEELARDPSMCNLLATSHRFRLYDDDDMLYFEGVMTGDDLQLFEPLDDFGMPGAGCTRIDVHERKGWVTV